MSLDPLLDWHRLVALRDSGCLDSPAEESFDRITRMAAEQLSAPVALISLVDADRNFFKSAYGLPEPWSDAREVPLSHSLCQHVVRDDAPLVVEDAPRHPRVRENLAVRDLSVAAYLGVPLRAPGGEPLGALCVGDVEPRRWSREDVAALAQLAAMVSPLLDAPAAPQRDALTGLADAAGVREAVHAAAARRRQDGGGVAVIAIGVDDLDLVNDAHGFAAGDALLVQIARRLDDAAGDAVVGRVAGDTFAVVAESGDDEDTVDVAVALRGALASAPFAVGDEVLGLCARVGIATTDPTAGADDDDLLLRASASLAHARALGRLVAGAGTEELHGRAEACDRIREALGGALGRDELQLLYRPLERDGELVALEAQLRWNGALGSVAPDAFLPVADQTGEIVTIGEWALRQALEAFAGWRATGAVGEHVDLILGVTPVQLRLASLPEAVIAAVADAGIPVARLMFQLDRSQRSRGVAAAAIDTQLAAIGVRVAAPGQGAPGATRGPAVAAGAVAWPGNR